MARHRATGNPVIRIDLRALDRVEVQAEADPDDNEAGEDSWDYDRRSVLVLSCGDLDVAIYIPDGPDAAERIVREAASVTGAGTTPDLVEILIIGNEPVLVRGDCIHIGIEAFRIEEFAPTRWAARTFR